MSKNYEHKNEEDLTVLTIGANRHDPALNNLYVAIRNEQRGGMESMAVVGRETIEEVIRAMAIEGGLIKEGETLTLKPKRKMPKDGTYVLTTSASACIVVIEDGKLFVPQTNGSSRPTGYMLDCSNSYLQNGSHWNLEPIKKG